MRAVQFQLGISHAGDKVVGELRRLDGTKVRTLIADSEPELVELARCVGVALESALPSGPQDVPDLSTANRIHRTYTDAVQGLLACVPEDARDGFLLCAQVTALNAFRRWLRIRSEGLQIGLEETTEDEDEALRDALVLQDCLESCRAEGAAAPEIQPIAQA